MNATFSALQTKHASWPSEILLALSSEPQDEQDEPSTGKNVDREPWEIIGCGIVLAVVAGAAGVWGWSFVEFLRLLVEMIPQAAS
jgi:hypothetical protein